MLESIRSEVPRPNEPSKNSIARDLIIRPKEPLSEQILKTKEPTREEAKHQAIRPRNAIIVREPAKEIPREQNKVLPRSRTND